MSIVRSPELGGLTDRRVRAAMFYSRKRRLERKRVGEIITGTPPAIGTLTNTSLLSSAITWTAPDEDGQDFVSRQMRVNGGQWVAFNSGQTVSTGELWTVREFLQNSDWVTKIFTSNTREVTA